MDTSEFYFGTMREIEIDTANNQLNYFRVIGQCTINFCFRCLVLPFVIKCYVIIN